MFNFDGQIVADALFIQQMSDVLHGIRENREAMTAADLQQELINLHHQYAQLVARYNRLADRYNWVLGENKRVDAVQAETIAEKDRRIAELEKENKDLRLNLLLTEDVVESQRDHLTDLLDRHQKGLP